MIKELKPCPFCGKIPQANEVFRERGIWKADVCCWGCGYAITYYAASREDAKRMAAYKWNTRYKRTCHVIIEDECPVCSECNEDIDPSWVACPYCGAEIVDGN